MTGHIRRNRGKCYVDLHYQGKRIRIFSDKDGLALDQDRAERLLSHIRYELDHGLFDARNYVRREFKYLQFHTYAETWLKRQERRSGTGGPGR